MANVRMWHRHKLHPNFTLWQPTFTKHTYAASERNTGQCSVKRAHPDQEPQHSQYVVHERIGNDKICPSNRLGGQIEPKRVALAVTFLL